jgi:hypothetical protein
LTQPVPRFFQPSGTRRRKERPKTGGTSTKKRRNRRGASSSASQEGDAENPQADDHGAHVYLNCLGLPDFLAAIDLVARGFTLI